MVYISSTSIIRRFYLVTFYLLTNTTFVFKAFKAIRVSGEIDIRVSGEIETRLS